MSVEWKLDWALRAFIGRRPVFFLETDAATVCIDVSPEGADRLRVLDDDRLF